MTEHKHIEFEPMTRLEGHAKISLDVTGGTLNQCHFHIIESPRMFERFMEGVPAEDAPQLSERICGICSVAHHLGSVKAVEAAWDITPPKQAVKLRHLENFGEYIHSHALHQVYLALPDFLTPQTPNVLAVAAKDPVLAKKGIELRMFGQNIIKAIGGRMIHPCTAIPGGMAGPLLEEDRDTLVKQAPKALKTARAITELYFKLARQNEVGLVHYYLSDPTYYLGLHKKGTHDIYDGTLRFITPDGKPLQDFNPADYTQYIAEDAMPYTTVKYPFIKNLGPEKGNYRVGPLARLNVAQKMASEEAQGYADQLFEHFGGRPIHDPILYNLARSIELLSAVEQAITLIEDSSLQQDNFRIPVEPRAGEGVGVVEAPRGTLFHHYWTNDDGFLTKVNCMIATGQNIRTIEHGVQQKAEELLPQLLLPRPESLKALARLEPLVRAYDPCISCSVHMMELIRDEDRISLTEF
ncbi:MAG: Ni/Fe hydrogenase subunit alpha [Candidatus Hodarchaeota archaeon]